MSSQRTGGGLATPRKALPRTTIGRVREMGVLWVAVVSEFSQMLPGSVTNTRKTHFRILVVGQNISMVFCDNICLFCGLCNKDSRIHIRWILTFTNEFVTLFQFVQFYEIALTSR